MSRRSGAFSSSVGPIGGAAASRGATDEPTNRSHAATALPALATNSEAAHSRGASRPHAHGEDAFSSLAAQRARLAAYGLVESLQPVRPRTQPAEARRTRRTDPNAAASPTRSGAAAAAAARAEWIATGGIAYALPANAVSGSPTYPGVWRPAPATHRTHVAPSPPHNAAYSPYASPRRAAASYSPRPVSDSSSPGFGEEEKGSPTAHRGRRFVSRGPPTTSARELVDARRREQAAASAALAAETAARRAAAANRARQLAEEAEMRRLTEAAAAKKNARAAAPAKAAPGPSFDDLLDALPTKSPPKLRPTLGASAVTRLEIAPIAPIVAAPRRKKGRSAISFATEALPVDKPTATSAAMVSSDASGLIDAAFLSSLKKKRATVVLDLPVAPVRLDELDHALVEHQAPAAEAEADVQVEGQLASEEEEPTDSLPSTGRSSVRARQLSVLTVTAAVLQVAHAEVEEPESPQSDLDVEVVNSFTDRASAIPSILAHLRAGDLLVGRVDRDRLGQAHAQAILRAAGIDGTKEGAAGALAYLDQLTLERARFRSVDELAFGVAAAHQAQEAWCHSLLRAIQKDDPVPCALLPAHVRAALTARDIAQLLHGTTIAHTARAVNHLCRVSHLQHICPMRTADAETTPTYASFDTFKVAVRAAAVRSAKRILSHALDLLRVYLAASPAVSSLFWEDLSGEITTAAAAADKPDALFALTEAAGGRIESLTHVCHVLERQGRQFGGLRDLRHAVAREAADDARRHREVREFLEHVSFGLELSPDGIHALADRLVAAECNLVSDARDEPLVLLQVLATRGLVCDQPDDLVRTLEELRARAFDSDEALDRIVLTSHLHGPFCSLWDRSEVDAATGLVGLREQQLTDLLVECAEFGDRTGAYALWFVLRIEGTGRVLPRDHLEHAVHEARLSEAAAQRALGEYLAFAGARTSPRSAAAAAPTAVTPFTPGELRDLCWSSSLGPLSSRLLRMHVQRLHLSGHTLGGSGPDARTREALAAAHGEWLESRRYQKRLLAAFLHASTCTLLPRSSLVHEGHLERLLRFNDESAGADSPVIPAALVLFAHVLRLNHQRRTFANVDQLLSGVRVMQEDTAFLYDSLRSALRRRGDAFGGTDAGESGDAFTIAALEPLVEEFAQTCHGDVASALVYAANLLFALPAGTIFSSVRDFFASHTESVRALTVPNPATSPRTATANIAAKSLYGIDKAMVRFFLATSGQFGASLFYTEATVRALSEADFASLIAASSTSSAQSGSVLGVFEVLLVLLRAGERFEAWGELVARCTAVAEELAAERKQCTALLNARAHQFASSPPVKRAHVERLFEVGQAATDTYDTLQAILAPNDEDDQPLTPSTFRGVDELIWTVRQRCFGGAARPTEESRQEGTTADPQNEDAVEPATPDDEVVPPDDQPVVVDTAESDSLPVSAVADEAPPPPAPVADPAPEVPAPEVPPPVVYPSELEWVAQHWSTPRAAFRSLLASSSASAPLVIDSDAVLDRLLVGGGGPQFASLSLRHASEDGRTFEATEDLSRFLREETRDSFDTATRVYEQLLSRTCALFVEPAPAITLVEARQLCINSECGRATPDALHQLNERVRAGGVAGHPFPSLVEVASELRTNRTAELEARQLALTPIREQLAATTLLPEGTRTSLPDAVLVRLLSLHANHASDVLLTLRSLEAAGRTFDTAEDLLVMAGTEAEALRTTKTDTRQLLNSMDCMLFDEPLSSMTPMTADAASSAITATLPSTTPPVVLTTDDIDRLFSECGIDAATVLPVMWNLAFHDSRLLATGGGSRQSRVDALIAACRGVRSNSATAAPLEAVTIEETTRAQLREVLRGTKMPLFAPSVDINAAADVSLDLLVSRALSPQPDLRMGVAPDAPLTPPRLTAESLLRYLREFAAARARFITPGEVLAAVLQRVRRATESAAAVAALSEAAERELRQQQAADLKRAESLARIQAAKTTQSSPPASASSKRAANKQPLPPPVISTDTQKSGVTPAASPSTSPASKQLIALLAAPTCTLTEDGWPPVDASFVARLIHFAAAPAGAVLRAARRLAQGAEGSSTSAAAATRHRSGPSVFATPELLVWALRAQIAAAPVLSAQSSSSTRGAGGPAAIGAEVTQEALSSDPAPSFPDLKSTLDTRLSSLATAQLSPAALEWLLMQSGGLLSCATILDANTRTFESESALGVALRQARMDSFCS